jgi:hypothetical protein
MTQPTAPCARTTTCFWRARPLLAKPPSHHARRAPTTQHQPESDTARAALPAFDSAPAPSVATNTVQRRARHWKGARFPAPRAATYMKVRVQHHAIDAARTPLPTECGGEGKGGVARMFGASMRHSSACARRRPAPSHKHHHALAPTP